MTPRLDAAEPQRVENHTEAIKRSAALVRLKLL